MPIIKYICGLLRYAFSYIHDSCQSPVILHITLKYNYFVSMLQTVGRGSPWLWRHAPRFWR